MTAPEFFKTLYGNGWTYEEILVTPFSELVLAVEACNDDAEFRQMQTLSVVNHIRSAVGADPIDPENPTGNAANKDKAKQILDNAPSHLKRYNSNG